MDKVQHFEIPADDLARAKKFYKEMFGWEINDIPEMEYTMLHTAPTDENNMVKEVGAINGGMYTRSPDGEGPMVVITVDNMDESIAKLKEHGGEVIKGPLKVGDMGLYIHFKDTEGNTLGMWQPLKK